MHRHRGLFCLRVCCVCMCVCVHSEHKVKCQMLEGLLGSRRRKRSTSKCLLQVQRTEGLVSSFQPCKSQSTDLLLVCLFCLSESWEGQRRWQWWRGWRWWSFQAVVVARRTRVCFPLSRFSIVSFVLCHIRNFTATKIRQKMKRSEEQKKNPPSRYSLWEERMKIS